MGAISFIYNMTPESLTLSKEETNVMIKPPSALKISTKSKSISVELSEVSPLQENFYRTPSDMESPHIVQIGELASHVYGQTTGFLGQIFKEVKVATDNATGAVDAVLDSVLGVPDESSSRDSNSTIQSRPSTMISSDSQNNSDSRNRNMPGTPKITQSNINQTNLDHSDSAQDIYLPTQSIYLPEDTSQNWWSTIKKNTSLPDFKFFNNDPNSAKTSASVSTATSPTTDRYPGDASFVNPIHSNISHKASNSQPRNHSNLQFSSDVDTPLTNEDYELQLAIALSKSTYIDENEREALLEDRELIEAMVQSAKESGNPLDLITFESGEDVRAAQDSNVKQNIVQIDKDVNI